MECEQARLQPVGNETALFDIPPRYGDQPCFQLPILGSEHKVL